MAEAISILQEQNETPRVLRAWRKLKSKVTRIFRGELNKSNENREFRLSSEYKFLAVTVLLLVASSAVIAQSEVDTSESVEDDRHRLTWSTESAHASNYDVTYGDETQNQSQEQASEYGPLAAELGGEFEIAPYSPQLLELYPTFEINAGIMDFWYEDGFLYLISNHEGKYSVYKKTDQGLEKVLSHPRYEIYDFEKVGPNSYLMRTGSGKSVGSSLEDQSFTIHHAQQSVSLFIGGEQRKIGDFNEWQETSYGPFDSDENGNWLVRFPDGKAIINVEDTEHSIENINDVQFNSVDNSVVILSGSKVWKIPVDSLSDLPAILDGSIEASKVEVTNLTSEPHSLLIDEVTGIVYLITRDVYSPSIFSSITNLDGSTIINGDTMKNISAIGPLIDGVITVREISGSIVSFEMTNPVPDRHQILDQIDSEVSSIKVFPALVISNQSGSYEPIPGNIATLALEFFNAGAPQSEINESACVYLAGENNSEIADRYLYPCIKDLDELNIPLIIPD